MIFCFVGHLKMAFNFLDLVTTKFHCVCNHCAFCVVKSSSVLNAGVPE